MVRKLVGTLAFGVLILAGLALVPSASADTCVGEDIRVCQRSLHSEDCPAQAPVEVYDAGNEEGYIGCFDAGVGDGCVYQRFSDDIKHSSWCALTEDCFLKESHYYNGYVTYVCVLPNYGTALICTNRPITSLLPPEDRCL